jgi:hypothetical protein
LLERKINKKALNNLSITEKYGFWSRFYFIMLMSILILFYDFFGTKIIVKHCLDLCHAAGGAKNRDSV